ncbi:MAG TPA: oxidoreductase [Rhodanobacter sp.]
MTVAPADTNRIRTGLIGYGFAGKTFHAPLINSVPGLDLVAVASSDASKVHADLPDVTVINDAAELIASDAVDLVVIAAPNALHVPLAKAALLAGKHVVIDKPMALDLDEARAVIALAQAQQRLLSVFHNRRWDSDFLAVRAAIERGLIGKVAHFESHIDRYRPEVRDRWREGSGPGAGIWYDLGPHLIDQALQLFGLPDRVHAHLAIQREGGMADDWAHALLDYGTHQVILHASMLVAGATFRFVVHGDRGSLLKKRIDQQEQQLLAGVIPGSDDWGRDSDALVHIHGDGTEHPLPVSAGDQRRYYLGIRDALNGTASNPVPPIQALAVMAVLQAGFDASYDGCAKPLALTASERASWS